jgi:CTP:molybdopterin cytidylyltransferase MocA
VSAAEPRIAGIILAAGAGRRFGGPKQLAPIGGRPMLDVVIDNALAVPALDPVLVVLGAHLAEVRAAIDFGVLPVVEAPDWDRGQSASLRAGVAAAGDVDAALILLGDQPFITPQVIAGAIGWDPEWHDAVRTTYFGEPGHPVLLTRRLLDEVASLDGDVGARDLLRRHRVRTFEAGHLADPTDIDTPGDLP